MPPLVLIVFGTRPEAIKLFPLIRALQRPESGVRVAVCVTGQHRELLHPLLRLFEIEPHYDLNVMSHNQSLSGLTARILERMDPVLLQAAPSILVVQGDTTTTLAASLAAFYRRIPAAHVEAGLRTGDLTAPFPEELNRVLTGHIAALHFAPTPLAAQNLVKEGTPADRVHVTGNTAIDALFYTIQRLNAGDWKGYEGPLPERGKALVVMTAHRRESFGDGFDAICRAVLRIAARGDVEFIYPVHPNPNVRQAVEKWLAGQPAIHLIEPQDYVPFVDLMRKADILLTDSGGVQEEGPSLGKPILVMRDKTERPEGVTAGAARLVGTCEDRIVAEVSDLLDHPERRAAFTAIQNPYGDGRAGTRMAALIHSFLNPKSEAVKTA